MMPVPLRANRRGPWTCRPAPLGTTANSAFRRSRMIATANAWPDRRHQNCTRKGRRQTGCLVQPRIALGAAKLKQSIQPTQAEKVLIRRKQVTQNRLFPPTAAAPDEKLSWRDRLSHCPDQTTCSPPTPHLTAQSRRYHHVPALGPHPGRTLRALEQSVIPT